MKNPTYVIDLKKLDENYATFSSFGRVYFPVKTNHNQIILNELKKLGSGFECDSVEHIQKVYSKDIAKDIMLSNVAKSDYDIEWALDHGICFYTIDDEQTLLKIIDGAKKRKFKNLKINVRLNVYDIFRAEFEKSGTPDSRLGASVKTCKRLLKIIDEQNGIEISRGVSFYVQKEVHYDEKFLSVVSDYIAGHFSKEDNIGYINIGGGATPSMIRTNHDKMMKDYAQIGVNIIILEPGRYMVGDVESLICEPRRVIDCDLGGGEKVVTLGVGIYHGLLDAKLHKRRFDIAISSGNKLVALKDYDGKGKKMVLRGPTADSSDIIGVFKDVKGLSTNTQFVISNIGAYVEVLHSDFSGKVLLDYQIKR